MKNAEKIIVRNAAFSSFVQGQGILVSRRFLLPLIEFVQLAQFAAEFL